MLPEEYLVVDLEMTGVSPKLDSVIEIGAIKVQKDKDTKEPRISTFSTLVRPRTVITKKIEDLTGITNEMAKGGMEPDAAMHAYFDFAGELPLVGHMIPCDFSFLKQWAINHKETYERSGIDTLRLAKKFLPELPTHRLSDLADYYDIEREADHRALDDARVTHILLLSLAAEFAEEHPEDFAPKKLQYHAKRQTPVTPQQIRYMRRYCEYFHLPMLEGTENMTRSDASRAIDRLIAAHGKAPKWATAEEEEAEG